MYKSCCCCGLEDSTADDASSWEAFRYLAKDGTAAAKKLPLPPPAVGWVAAYVKVRLVIRTTSLLLWLSAVSCCSSSSSWSTTVVSSWSDVPTTCDISTVSLLSSLLLVSSFFFSCRRCWGVSNASRPTRFPVACDSSVQKLVCGKMQNCSTAGPCCCCDSGWFLKDDPVVGPVIKGGNNKDEELLVLWLLLLLRPKYSCPTKVGKIGLGLILLGFFVFFLGDVGSTSMVSVVRVDTSAVVVVVVVIARRHSQWWWLDNAHDGPVEVLCS
mmetsp:Transcript_9913/g.21595  ORF Transcript_9913/g.21595 Transcript_9913/m.21595 type:complete len:270 (-) Transcript_9913:46-855(-)